jgi:hypothetical protein
MNPFFWFLYLLPLLVYLFIGFCVLTIPKGSKSEIKTLFFCILPPFLWYRFCCYYFSQSKSVLSNRYVCHFISITMICTLLWGLVVLVALTALTHSGMYLLLCLLLWFLYPAIYLLKSSYENN